MSNTRPYPSVLHTPSSDPFCAGEPDTPSAASPTSVTAMIGFMLSIVPSKFGIERHGAHNARLLAVAQNLFHFPALREFVYQLVEIPDLPRQPVLDLFHAIATDHASDEARIGIQLSHRKKCLKSRLFFDELVQLSVINACQPSNNLVQFVASSTFLFHFREIHRIDRGEGHLRYALVVSAGSLHNKQDDRRLPRLNATRQAWHPTAALGVVK